MVSSALFNALQLEQSRIIPDLTLRLASDLARLEDKSWAKQLLVDSLRFWRQLPQLPSPLEHSLTALLFIAVQDKQGASEIQALLSQFDKWKEEEEEKRRARLLAQQKEEEERRKRLLAEQKKEEERRKRLLAQQKKEEEKKARLLAQQKEEEERTAQLLAQQKKEEELSWGYLLFLGAAAVAGVWLIGALNSENN